MCFSGSGWPLKNQKNTQVLGGFCTAEVRFADELQCTWRNSSTKSSFQSSQRSGDLEGPSFWFGGQLTGGFLQIFVIFTPNLGVFQWSNFEEHIFSNRWKPLSNSQVFTAIYTLSATEQLTKITRNIPRKNGFVSFGFIWRWNFSLDFYLLSCT